MIRRARSFSRRPGRPAGSGARPRARKPGERKALARLPKVLARMAAASRAAAEGARKVAEAVGDLEAVPWPWSELSPFDGPRHINCRCEVVSRGEPGRRSA